MAAFVKFLASILPSLLQLFKALGAHEERARQRQVEAEIEDLIGAKRDELTETSEDDIEKRLRRWQRP